MSLASMSARSGRVIASGISAGALAAVAGVACCAKAGSAGAAASRIERRRRVAARGVRAAEVFGRPWPRVLVVTWGSRSHHAGIMPAESGQEVQIELIFRYEYAAFIPLRQVRSEDALRTAVVVPPVVPVQVVEPDRPATAGGMHETAGADIDADVGDPDAAADDHEVGRGQLGRGHPRPQVASPG